MTGAARLRRLDGSSQGTAFELARSFTLLGHHAAADLSFPTPRTAGVSPRHAAIIRTGMTWLLRDLQSAEGTWVNGRRITADQELQPGDEIRLGADGPSLRFEASTVVPAPPPRSPNRRRWISALALVAVATGAALAWQAYRGRSVADAERVTLVSRVDSLGDQLAAANARASRLSSLLRDASLAAATTRQALTATSAGPSARLDSLGAVVRELAERQGPLLRAANLDLAALATGNQDAVVLVLAERVGGSVVSGTGFALRQSGDTSWVVTSRHVVQGQDGRDAIRLGIVFNGTAQNFRAVLERVHPDADLALLRVVVAGGTPVVQGLDGPVAVGVPVGTITFPGELDLAPTAAWRRVGVAASSFSATITEVNLDRLQLDGYGVEGMSGSPIFTAAGKVAGVIYGGAAGAGGRIVFAVPAARVRELLEGG